MTLDKILSEYVNHSDREREVGKYYSSEVGSIIKGYLKPEDFFNKRKIDNKGVKNILSGRAFEAEFKRALDHSKIEYEHEPKKYIEFEGISISVKPDFIIGDRIIECKFPVRMGTPEEYLERYEHQMECQYRAFGKDVYLGLFSHPFTIKTYKFEPCDKRFELIKEELLKFHNKIKHG
jgi:hypothetical protein